MNNLVLFGFKNVGKSSFGKKLSERLFLPFIDTDELMTKCYTKSPRELYLELGEEKFSQLEHLTLCHIPLSQPIIIALGGGTLTYPDNLALVEKMGRAVYLEIEKERLQKRLLAPPLPAFLQSENPVISFEAYYRKRIAIFETIQAYRLSIEGKSDEAIVNELERIYHGKQ